MELILTLLLLYGAQCLIRLSSSDVIFVRPLWRWRSSPGPGWRLLHALLPGGSYLGTRVPLLETDGVLCGMDRSWRDKSHTLPVAGEAAANLAVVAVRGKQVRVDDRIFYRAPTKAVAVAVAELLSDLVRGEAEAGGLLQQYFAKSYSLASFRRDRERLKGAGRWLEWACFSYLALLFIGVPILMWILHEEAALLTVFPVLVVVHLATLGLMMRAHAKLLPAARAERFEATFAAAFYPPLLLRTPHDLRVRLLGNYHPMVLAGDLLGEEDRRNALRGEWMRSEGRVRASVPEIGVGLAEAEQRALLELIGECGESVETLLAPRSAADPVAEAFCPICDGDYLRRDGLCSDCQIELIAYAPAEDRARIRGGSLGTCLI